MGIRKAAWGPRGWSSRMVNTTGLTETGGPLLVSLNRPNSRGCYLYPQEEMRQWAQGGADVSQGTKLLGGRQSRESNPALQTQGPCPLLGAGGFQLPVRPWPSRSAPWTLLTGVLTSTCILRGDAGKSNVPPQRPGEPRELPFPPRAGCQREITQRTEQKQKP